MFLSVVIPTLNEEKYLPGLLRSLKDQDFSDMEIIVSDGDSSDRTRELALSFGAKVLVDKSRGPARQRNLGASQAIGEAILFLDADDFLDDVKFISAVVAEFRKRDLALAGFLVRFNSPKIIYHFFGLVYNLFTIVRTIYKPIAVGAGIMVKKELHDLVGGFNESLGVNEDHEYVTVASSLGKFGILRSRKLNFSVRRLEKEGALKMIKTWIKMAYYDILGKKSKPGDIDYEFGKYNK
jgi:glycosyltransferase involved in cell wall biosynthesis